MNELDSILKEYEKESESPFYIEIEAYSAKKHCILSISKYEGFIRLFPLDGSHYIDIIEDYGIDNRVFIVFRQLFETKLINYIAKLSVHEGTLRVQGKKIYTNGEIKNAFDYIFHGHIDVAGDIWGYEFMNDL